MVNVPMENVSNVLLMLTVQLIKKVPNALNNQELNFVDVLMIPIVLILKLIWIPVILTIRVVLNACKTHNVIQINVKIWFVVVMIVMMEMIKEILEEETLLLF